jgi:hypothetical protein
MAFVTWIDGGPCAKVNFQFEQQLNNEVPLSSRGVLLNCTSLPRSGQLGGFSKPTAVGNAWAFRVVDRECHDFILLELT